MAVSALDSRIFRNIFGTQEIRDVFTDEAYTKYMVQTEAALARAESSAGAIPAEIGESITRALDDVKLE
jgi:3-carboxy-cis,cis-muconate cycloisomerase